MTNEPMTYRKKPVVIEAMRVPQTHEIDDRLTMEAWMKGARSYWYGRYLRIETLEGEMTAYPGDWVVKGVAGEFYPVRPDIFEATYEIPAPQETQ